MVFLPLLEERVFIFIPEPMGASSQMYRHVVFVKVTTLECFFNKMFCDCLCVIQILPIGYY